MGDFIYRDIYTYTAIYGGRARGRVGFSTFLAGCCTYLYLGDAWEREWEWEWNGMRYNGCVYLSKVMRASEGVESRLLVYIWSAESSSVYTFRYLHIISYHILQHRV